MNKQGSAATKDRGVAFVSVVLFLILPRGGLVFAIQFRCYPMRIAISLLVLILSSCTKENKPFEVPKGVEGGWKLVSSTAINPPPDWLGPLGLKNSTHATYSGPIDTTVDFFEFKADSSAFECKQRWRPVKGEDQFYTRNLFIVVRSPHPNKEMMMDFSRALQKAL
jgi:hypothetical protein